MKLGEERDDTSTGAERKVHQTKVTELFISIDVQSCHSDYLSRGAIVVPLKRK